ncbi:MAG: hypothetical protein DRJ69_00130 [Thermoprotei archaeon]|nr:MAG: hypothetical protein DRJ69_00130 [Thermoprotei archaeon]
MKLETQKVQTSLRLSPDLLRRFQRYVKEGFGKLRGAQELALNDAVKLWVSLIERQDDVFFGFIETKDGWRGYRVLFMDEALRLLDNLRNANMMLVWGAVHPPLLEGLLALNPVKVFLAKRGAVWQRREVNERDPALLVKRLYEGGNEILMVLEDRRIASISPKGFAVEEDVGGLLIKRLLPSQDIEDAAYNFG